MVLISTWLHLGPGNIVPVTLKSMRHVLAEIFKGAEHLRREHAAKLKVKTPAPGRTPARSRRTGRSNVSDVPNNDHPGDPHYGPEARPGPNYGSDAPEDPNHDDNYVPHAPDPNERNGGPPDAPDPKNDAADQPVDAPEPDAPPTTSVDDNSFPVEVDSGGAVKDSSCSVEAGNEFEGSGQRSPVPAVGNGHSGAPSTDLHGSVGRGGWREGGGVEGLDEFFCRGL